MATNNSQSPPIVQQQYYQHSQQYHSFQPHVPQQYLQHFTNPSATSFHSLQNPYQQSFFNPLDTPGTLSKQSSNISIWKAILSVGTLEGDGSLLEELGVNFSHMATKSLAVLNPFGKRIDHHIMDDADIAGPIVFCLLLGAFLLVSGKIQFGYIYGVGVLGCISVYLILNLMSDGAGIDSSRTASVLGYCLLPMVLLSGLSIGIDLKGHWVALSLGIISIIWCTFSSCTIFVTILSMKDQRMLIAYPIGLFYTCFALLTIF